MSLDIGITNFGGILQMDKIDARRYRYLRKLLANGEETYIGEWVTTEDQLDEHVDKLLEKGQSNGNNSRRT